MGAMSGDLVRAETVERDARIVEGILHLRYVPLGYVQVNVTRVERLPDSYTLVLTTLSQWASARLVPSNEFGLGGALSVRGYDERIVNGDDGVSGQLELRTPPRHLLDQIPDSTQALIFLDAGRAWQHNLLPGETDNTLSSVGPGLRMTNSSRAR